MKPASTQTFFAEEQSFRQTWVWFAVLPSSAVVLLIFAIGLYQQLYLGKPFGDNPVSDRGLLIIALLIIPIVIGLPILFYKMKLVVRLLPDKLHIKFSPFVHKQIPLHDIVRCEPRKYSPIREFGGWGIRYGGKKRGWAYNVAGNRGVQLELANGKLLLIGSQRADELAAAIQQLRGV